MNAAGTAVVVSFNEWLAGTVELGGSPPATSVLTVTVDGVPRTPTSVSINRHQVTLSLPSGMRVVSGQDVTLTYAQPVNNPLQDRYGNQVASFVGQQVTNNIPLVWGSKDYDTDNDGLIEIKTAGQLNAVRWDTDGDGDPSRGYYLDAGAFAGAAQGMGCPVSGCVGYEIGIDTRGETTINLSSYTDWEPIPSFSGTLDGNGHTVSGLTISDRRVAGAGLFAEVASSGKVRNLGLTDVSITANQQVGAVAGTNRGLISGVHATGTITRRSNNQPGNPTDIGGLVGFNDTAGIIEVSYSEVTVTTNVGTGSSSNVGGLVGRNLGKIQAAYSTGAVTVGSATRVGGFVGHNLAGASIRASYAIGCVTTSSSTTNFGAFIGHGVTTNTHHNYFESKGGGCSAFARGATAKTAAQLQSPTGYSGIYANWNLDIDGDGQNDFPWRFPAGKYPELNLGQPTIIGVALLSRPADGATFKAGELIRLQATFNEDVAFGAGTVHPWPSLSLHSLDGWFTAEAQPPRQESDKGFSKTMEFGYRVRAGDQATDQLAAGTHPLSGGGLSGGTPSIASRGGTPANPLMDLFPLGVTVDGGAVATCRQDLTIRPWSDLEYHRLKWSTRKLIDWDGSCYSRSRPGQHANYYTFTLTGEAQVRLHAEGRGQPGLMLREGRVYTGDVIHHAARYGSRSNAVRIEQVLQPGTYTLETAGAHSLWTGTVDTPFVEFVTNFGLSQSGNSGNADNDHAQAFTAGSNASGYKLTGVGLHFAFTTPTGSTDPTYALSIWSADSNGRPADRLATLVKSSPGLLTRGLNRFTVSGPPVHLQATKTYVVVWDTIAAGDRGWVINNTTSDDEQPGAAPGWSIANASLFRGRNSNGAWSPFGESRFLSVYGALSECAIGIDRGESYPARWDAGCASVSNPGVHAAYYMYTPESGGITRVTLTSPDTDEHVYLWEDGRQIRETGSSGHKYAEMAWVARAGSTYVLEVTADSPNAGSRYLLAMHGGGGTTEAPSLASGCRHTVEFGRQAGGVLDWPCYSMDRPGTYARYYTFTIGQERDVRLELYGSQIAGADMTLRQGTNGSGPYVIQSFFPGIGPVRARIDKEALPAGTYTVEVMASSPGNGGHLTLTVKDMPPKYEPSDQCRIDLGDITYVGTWSDSHTEEWGASGCGTFSRTGAYARFFRFELTHTVKLGFSLNGGPDSRIYLYKGASFRDSDVIENDLSFIEQNLAPGTYTIEVTTLYGDGRSDDEYTFAYRRTGPAPPEPTGSGPTSGQVWSSTLTVQAEDYPEGFLGCWNSCAAAIADHDFFIGTTRYQIGAIGHDEDSFSLGIRKTTLPSGTWTLYVQKGDGTEHPFTLSSRVRSWGWGGITLGWTAGQQVSLRLVKS